ncbi:MFS transporter [Streptomyces axinellae]|uniref:MFS transporter n=1 Tax=Streptomyces axinellae TaxID=552788 RepID=A0ABP6DFV7_9ACTN
MRAYLAAATLARLADEGMALALPLLALERTGSAAQGAYALTAWMAPHMVAAPVVGALAERARRPRLFFGAALALFALALSLLGVLLGQAPTALTSIVAVAGGSCGPAVTGGLSSLLTAAPLATGPPAGSAAAPAGARARVHALDAATYNAASVTAPAAVSAVALALTPAWATAFLSASAACAALLAPALPLPADRERAARPARTRRRERTGTGPPPRPPRRTRPALGRLVPTARTGRRRTARDVRTAVGVRVTGGVRAVMGVRAPAGARTAGSLRAAVRRRAAPLTVGVHALWRVPHLRALTVATSVAFLGVGALPVTAVLLAAHRGNADGGGLLMTAFALGALAGSVLPAARPPRMRPERLAALSLSGTGAALAGAAPAPSFSVSVALFALAGAGDGPLLSTTLRLRAEHAPEGARTQVFTLGAGLKLSAAAAGAALVGRLSWLDPAPVLLAIGALQLLAALLLHLLSPRTAAVPAGPGGPGTGRRRAARRAG